jgi:hypothetical protein
MALPPRGRFFALPTGIGGFSRRLWRISSLLFMCIPDYCVQTFFRWEIQG